MTGDVEVEACIASFQPEAFDNSGDGQFPVAEQFQDGNTGRVGEGLENGGLPSAESDGSVAGVADHDQLALGVNDSTADELAFTGLPMTSLLAVGLLAMAIGAVLLRLSTQRFGRRRSH